MKAKSGKTSNQARNGTLPPGPTPDLPGNVFVGAAAKELQPAALHGAIGEHPDFPITDEETAAVTADYVTTIIRGCPGAGKSAVLCGHIIHLITPDHRSSTIKPSQIIVVTTEQKSADEITMRMQSAQGAWNRRGGDAKPFVGTHAKFMLHLLNEFKQFAGYPSGGRSVNWLTKDDKDCFADRDTAWLREHGYTHDQLITDDILALLQSGIVQKTLQRRAYHLHILDAQDMGPDETKVYRAFPAKKKYVVGDSAQELCEFPPGKESLLTTMNRWENAVTIRLTTNYRSFPNICAAANQLIKYHLPDLRQPDMRAVRTPSNPEAPCVLQWQGKNQKHELELMIKIVRHYTEVGKNGHDWSKIGIIYQTEDEAHAIALALDKSGIPRADDSNDRPFQPKQNTVHLASLAQCRGSSYENVIIPFCTEFNWPGELNPNLARRRLYVAMTRAQNTVHFTFAGDPSPFLAEINKPRRVVELKLSQPSFGVCVSKTQTRAGVLLLLLFLLSAFLLFFLVEWIYRGCR